MEKYHPATFKTEMDWSNGIRVGNSIQLKWIKELILTTVLFHLFIFFVLNKQSVKTHLTINILLSENLYTKAKCYLKFSKTVASLILI